LRIHLTDVFFRRSANGGASFGDIINLSNSNNIHSKLPSLTLLDLNVYTAWSEGPFDNGEVYYRLTDVPILDGLPGFPSIGSLTGFQSKNTVKIYIIDRS